MSLVYIHDGIDKGLGKVIDCLICTFVSAPFHIGSCKTGLVHPFKHKMLVIISKILCNLSPDGMDFFRNLILIVHHFLII